MLSSSFIMLLYDPGAKVKVRSRSFQGQGHHMKVKGFLHLKLALQVYNDYKSAALVLVYTVANITYLSHYWGQGEGHFKVISRSRSFEGQSHLKVRVISRSRSFKVM